MTQPALDRSPADWRSLYPPHPCADVFPMLPDDELDALAQDITKNGLQKPIVLQWTTGKNADGLFDVRVRVYRIIDGRNRLAAIARAGISIPTDPYKTVRWADGRDVPMFEVWNLTDDDAAVTAYIIAANIRRRHLTKEQQAELIVKTIEAGKAIDAEKNESAKVARSFSPTTGQRGGSTKDPVLHAAVTEAKKHGISPRTVERARAKLQGKTPKAKPKLPAVVPSSAPIRSSPATDQQVNRAAGVILACLRDLEQRHVKKPIILAAAKRIFVSDQNSGWRWESAGRA